MNVLSGILAVITLLFGIYFRESISKAYKQKQIAIRLDAYLTQWQHEFMLPPLKDLIGKLEFFDQLFDEIAPKANLEGSKQLYDHFVFIVFSQIKETFPDWKDKVDLTGMTNQDPVLLEANIDDFIELRRNFLDNKLFISEEEASLLGMDIALGVTKYKSNTVSTLGCLVAVMRMVKVNADPSEKTLLLVGYLMLTLKSIRDLKADTLKFRSKSIHELFWLNLIGKQ